jgi:hypothetical protein
VAVFTLRNVKYKSDGDSSKPETQVREATLYLVLLSSLRFTFEKCILAFD